MAETFKQIQYIEHSDQYAAAGQFTLVEQPVPELKEGQVLVKLVCAATNPVDTVIKRGLVKDLWPQAGRLPFVPGYDFSGVVVQVGESVEGFAAGDQVCGVQWGDGSKGGRYHADAADDGPVGGSLAEMMVVPATTLVKKPGKVDFKQAAAAPMVCLTASQGLFSYNKVKSGDKVIIFGGTSAVGSMAVQLAKNKGANVFATCSTGKMSFVKDLGATPIDYTTQNWWEVEGDFDAGFIANIGDADSAHLKDAGAFKDGAIVTSVLTPSGTVEEGTPKIVKFVFNQDAEALSEMMADIEAGKLKVTINKLYDLLSPENVGAMFVEQASGKSLGKNVILCRTADSVDLDAVDEKTTAVEH